MREATKAFEGRSRGVALLLIVLLHVLLCVAARPGFTAGDDYWYAMYANDLVRGEFALAPDSFANRPGILLPTALAYSVLGVSEVSTVLWPFLCSIATILLVFHLARSAGGDFAGVAAAGLVAVNSAQLSSSLLLMPDAPTAAWLLAALVAVRAGRRSDSRGGRVGAALLLALFVTAAFLTKLSAVWIVPLFLVAGTADLLRGRNRDFWLAAAGFLAVAGAGYLLTYHALTGDAFYRLHAIEGGHNLSQFSYVGGRAGDLATRLTWEPLHLLLRKPELGVPVLIAVPAAVTGLLSGDGDRRTAAFVFVSFLAAWWLLTTSLEAWTPMPLNPRMFHPVLPVAAIVAGVTLTRTRTASAAAGVLFAAAVAAWPLAGAVRAAFFAGAGEVVAFGIPIARRDLRVAPLLPALPLLLLAVYGVARGGVGETRAQAAERRIVATHLSDPREETVVAMVFRAECAVRFRLGFEPSPLLTIVTGEDAARALAGEEGRPVVFASEERLSYFGERREAQLDLPALAAERGLSAVDSEAGVTLYR